MDLILVNITFLEFFLNCLIADSSNEAKASPGWYYNHNTPICVILEEVFLGLCKFVYKFEIQDGERKNTPPPPG